MTNKFLRWVKSLHSRNTGSAQGFFLLKISFFFSATITYLGGQTLALCKDSLITNPIKKPKMKIPDVVLCRPAASKQVSHAARGFPSFGCFLGVAHMHAHHSGRCESTAHVFLRLGEHDVHLEQAAFVTKQLFKVRAVVCVRRLPLVQTCSRGPPWR